MVGKLISKQSSKAQLRSRMWFESRGLPTTDLSPYFKPSIFPAALSLFQGPTEDSTCHYFSCAPRFPECVTVSQTVFICVDLGSVDLGSIEKFWSGL
jgi:hypothetical protein